MSETIVTIGDDYSFMIPQALLEALGWRPGTRLALMPQPDGTVLVEEVGAPPEPVSKGQ